jgi:hypothetical protein
MDSQQKTSGGKSDLALHGETAAKGSDHKQEGKSSTVRLMPVSQLRVDKDLSAIFDVAPEIKAALSEKMAADGYDDAFPLIVRAADNAIVDGHTRYAAALEAGIESVPVVVKAFDTDYDTLCYAIKAQVNRRNLTDADIFKLAESMDRKWPRGGARDRSKTSNEGIESSADYLAKLLGTYRAKIERIRAIQKRGSTEMRNGIDAGMLTINKAYSLLPSAKSKVAKAARADKSVVADPVETITLNGATHSDDVVETAETTTETLEGGSGTSAPSQAGAGDKISEIALEVSNSVVVGVPLDKDCRQSLNSAIKLLEDVKRLLIDVPGVPAVLLDAIQVAVSDILTHSTHVESGNGTVPFDTPSASGSEEV